MRLRSLTLERYGNFTAPTTLRFETAPGRLNLLVAPNGAGKSVLRQAVTELLFGIHAQTRLVEREDYGRVRLSAEAEFADGTVAGFVRRKGSANTLSPLPGQPLPAARLPQESERKRLERLFVMDSAQLRDGGRALLQSDGDLADALLSGAGELRSVRDLAADLARQRDAAAPRRRTATAPFYQTADAWTGAGTRLLEALAPPGKVAQHEAARLAAEHALRDARLRARQARTALARLERIQRTARPLAALADAQAWLDAHPEAPCLPEAAGTALASATQAVADASRQVAEAQQLLAGLTAQLAGLPVDTAVLAEAEAIARLQAERAIAQAAREDTPKREAELAAAELAIGQLMRTLGSPRPPAEAAAEIRPAADIATARGLIAQHAELAVAATGAQQQAELKRQALAETADALAALPEPAATDRLRVLHEEAVAEGDPARRAATAAQAAADAAARLATALAAVPGWSGTDAALAALAPPGEATLTRLDDARTQAQAATAAALQRRAERAQELAEQQDRLARTGAATLPDAAALDDARARREQGWHLVAARLAGTPDPAAETRFGTPLAGHYAQAVAAADAVADRWIAEAPRVALATAAKEELARAQAALAAAQGQLAACQEAERAARTAWAAALRPAGLDGEAGLAEARAFLAARQAALAASEDSARAAAAQAELQAAQDATAAGLAAELGLPAERLPRLAMIAKARLAEADGQERERQALRRRLATGRRQMEEAQPSLNAARQHLAAWQAAWEEALARLGRPPGEATGVTGEVLDVLVALSGEVDRAETARGRLGEMGRQLTAYEAACAAAASRLGVPHAAPDQVASLLAERLEAAHVADGQRQTLAAQRDAAQERLQGALLAQTTAEAALAKAIAATGAADPEAAGQRVAAAAERRVQEAARRAALQQLSEGGDGLTPEALRQEAMPPAELDAARAEAKQDETLAEQAIDAAARDSQKADTELDTLKAGEAALHAAADRQAAASRLSRVLEDALVQHLAATMLGEALAAVEAAGTSNDKLDRIGQRFAQLTSGAYDRLSPAEEDGEARDHGRLIAHTVQGGEVHIARLSEGTRDQLYLALRLVAIEDHVRKAAPLPFIADDILQTFDDERARAALEALAALSREVQVIVLTHHPHVARLAEGLEVFEVRPGALPLDPARGQSSS